MIDQPQQTQGNDDRTEITADQIKAAFKAFKRKLKLARLDEESSLGGRGLTGGRKSGIAGIMPPPDHPTEVWELLVQQGKLRKMGRGTYGLADED